MRVAHFVQRFPPALGGSEAYFARLSRFLAAVGHDVTVHTTTGLDLESFWSRSARQVPAGVAVDNGVTIYRHALKHLPLQRYLLKGLALLCPIPRWRPWLLTCNPLCPTMWAAADRDPLPCDVVHATAFPYSWPLLCAQRLAARRGVPFLLTPFLHLGDPDDPHDRTRRAYTQPGLRGLLRSADRVFAQTEGERQALVNLGIAEERIVLQGLGVDIQEQTGGDRGKARSAWGVAADEVVVGHLANNSREKGTVDLLQAADRAWANGASFVLVLAGPEMPNFRSFWARHRPVGRVLRLGALDEAGKRDFFAALDVFALPSRVDSFGLVFLEAWANGLPTLAYRAGGVPWVIRHEVDGLLARCGNLDELADGVFRLVGDPELRRRLGASGRARVLKEFRWQDKLGLVDQVMREVSERRAEGSSQGLCP
jgi:glycosyltransferase involved in cell wall biosynthesis